MAEVMEHLGFARFAAVGHDRGGRVAYRLALDHPGRVQRLAVLDIVPTGDTWDRADRGSPPGTGHGPSWRSLRRCPSGCCPQRLSAAPDAVVDAALSGWGSPPGTFGPSVRAAYIAALSDPGHIHAICEEYRAAATIDRHHDAEDRRRGRRITCPVLVLWGAGGPLDTWYITAGGPLGLWRSWADDVRGHAITAGHFFPEEQPDQTAAELRRFLAADGA